MSIYHLTEQPCPSCNYLMNGANDITETESEARSPIPGDLTVCISCGTILEFTPDLSLAEASQHSVISLAIEQPDDAKTIFEFRQLILRKKVV